MLIHFVILVFSQKLYFLRRIRVLSDRLNFSGFFIQYKFWLLDLLNSLKDLDIICRPGDPVKNVVLG